MHVYVCMRMHMYVDVCRHVGCAVLCRVMCYVMLCYTMPQAIYASKIQGSKIGVVSKWSGKNDRAQGAQNLHCMLGGVEIDKPYTANFYSRRWRARSCRPHWGEAASGRA